MSPTRFRPALMLRRLPASLRRHKAACGLVAAALGANVAILLALGISTGPIVAGLTILAALLALILALVDHFDQQVQRRSIWIVFLVGLLAVPTILGLVMRPDDFGADQSVAITDKDLMNQSSICERDDDCRLERRMDVTDGQSSYTVGIIGKFNSSGGDLKYNNGSGVVVLTNRRALAWRSEFLPGYGFIELTTDNSGNAFMSFAVTNHSSIAWVLGASEGKVRDYGTTSGRLQIDAFTDPGLEGIRQLYTFRTGWPSKLEEGALADVWSWNASSAGYEYVGCGTTQTWGSHTYASVITGKCSQPVGKHSVNLS